MNLFKPVAQLLVNAALPVIKIQLKTLALKLAQSPKYAALPTAVLLPYLDDLLDGWTIKL